MAEEMSEASDGDLVERARTGDGEASSRRRSIAARPRPNPEREVFMHGHYHGSSSHYSNTRLSLVFCLLTSVL
jgi:hypothetical protein